MSLSALIATVSVKRRLCQTTVLTSGRSILQPDNVLSRVPHASEIQLQTGVSPTNEGIIHPCLCPTGPQAQK